MSAPVRMFGYLREYSDIKPHEVATAPDEKLADAILWSTHDWRDDPSWICVSMGELTMQRLPSETFVPQQVENLRRLQQQVRTDAEIRAREIEQQINSLLAITHEVAA